MPNELLKRMNGSYFAGFDDGQRLGQQQILDFATVYLARKGWSGKELVDFFNGCADVSDKFSKAFNPSMEQDVYQERLDAELEAAYESETEFVPFAKRYPPVKNMGYDRAVKEERHPAAKKRGKRR